MAKIQIIIDDEESLKAYTCTGVELEQPTMDYELSYLYEFRYFPHKLNFTAEGILIDDSPTLVSLPDELLLRIRDYNIDAEHQHTVKMTRKLKKKNDGLQWLIESHTKELEGLKDEVKLYNEVLEEIVDKYPKVAAAVALKLGNLDAACYFSAKENQEEDD